MEIETIRSRVSDNYFYAAVDAGEVALVDPVDGSTAVDWAHQHGLEVRYLVNTHFHQDHTGGNRTVLEAHPTAEVVAGEGDADRIDDQMPQHGVDRRVAQGETVELGDGELEVLETPGHTSGHVSFLADDHLLSGDTIFVAGAGNCNFGGDVGALFRTFRDVVGGLDDEVTFYPGHDYSVRDLEFVLSVEPDNARAEEMLERAESTPDDEIFLATLGEERSYSPFFRYDEEPLQDRLRDDHADVWERSAEIADSDDETAFRTVRALRDEW